MSCCSGNCSCGKKSMTIAQEQVFLAQLDTSKGLLSTFDWMQGLNELKIEDELLEIRFKNNRKAFFRNSRRILLKKDDRVIVDVDGGHDLGTVSLIGDLAKKQFSQKEKDSSYEALQHVYRKATTNDLEKWLEARKNDHIYLKDCRSIAGSLGLEMHINDVELRGDGKKLTVYYTANGRVDFRELLKKYMSKFGMKIEMKQIGSRQNAARTGGIGSCGRELCCSTWKTDMKSVKTDAARKQDLALNAERLAGQCGKLKCCLNYELETYLEAWESFPAELIELETDRGILRPLQADLLKGVVHYASGEQKPGIRYTVSVEDLKKYIALNKKGTIIKTARIATA